MFVSTVVSAELASRALAKQRLSRLVRFLLLFASSGLTAFFSSPQCFAFRSLRVFIVLLLVAF
jgi:hypothetical protein